MKRSSIAAAALLAGSLLLTGCLQFLWVWNDMLVALIFLGQGDNTVVTVALANILGTRGENWHLLTAGAFISMILPLVVFFALQRFFVRGLTAGAVKG